MLNLNAEQKEALAVLVAREDQEVIAAVPSAKGGVLATHFEDSTVVIASVEDPDLRLKMAGSARSHARTMRAKERLYFGADNEALRIE